MREILLAQEFNEKIPAGLRPAPGWRTRLVRSLRSRMTQPSSIRQDESRTCSLCSRKEFAKARHRARLIADISRLVWNHTMGQSR